ncbi:2-5A-dependent ribonuclease [Pseudonaja textilis]|uniref:2-5A-dependent ribonuclease n=1 Tax=Pseudonaja textilis TaxID=8673 RepID=UPI000EAA4469|nr:2-5A-dependent ribonuclease [Pseudonaja textilis]XP_026559064.1 2-5A-dependent ribonuclease [Pseudonaja textilis]XP_026559065.1 2-5A-dependent ribonuclease [Pseudonaja textilis]
MATELNTAVKNGDLMLVRQLLEDGADINAKVEYGWTPLHSAVQINSKKIVKFLLEKGADPLARKDNGATPFILAGLTGNVKLLKLFLDKGSSINECDINGFTAFMEAACEGKEKALRFLYKRGADVNQRREVDENKKAVKKGGATALMDAAKHGHFALVKILIKKMGADINICDNRDGNALIHALSEEENWNKSRQKLALFLLKNNIDAKKRDVKGKTVLILAVERESLALVKAILKLDEVDLDDADENNETALHVAVKKKNIAIAKLLCEKRARVDNDVLDIARRTYQDKMIKLLQKYKSPDSPRQPEEILRRNCQEFSSNRWKSKLQKLSQMHRPMIGKLKIFEYQDLWIQKTTQGGVYLGFYAGEEVAVKVLWKGSENAQREKMCLEKCRNSKYLVKFRGSEERKAILYLCLTLCEKNLQEYFKEENSTAMESKKILKKIFQAVKELHAFGFGHQELHPSNILIDVTGKIFLADFDKSREITDDTKHSVISEDLQGLQKLILYVVKRGELDFEHLPTECPKTVKEHKEIEDLRGKLKLPDKTTLADSLLEMLIYHPYFWSKEKKYSALRDIGNEIRTAHATKTNGILKALKCEHDPFMDWQEKIDKKVLDSMVYPGKEKGNKRVPRKYGREVIDLLKLIRNMAEHYNEKDNEVKKIIQDPADYFLNLFPDLTLHIYQLLYDSEYSKYFPNAKNSSHP